MCFYFIKMSLGTEGSSFSFEEVKLPKKFMYSLWSAIKIGLYKIECITKNFENSYNKSSCRIILVKPSLVKVTPSHFPEA